MTDPDLVPAGPTVSPPACGLIALLTDFGLDDPYVGIMKGVIARLNPAATVLDLCHGVRPQNVREGAFLLATALPYFPPGTVFVAVVDPGVGTARRPLALATPAGFFVGPDNGLLTWALPGGPTGLETTPREGPLPPGVRAVELTNPAYWLPTVSATFHGRDIFAPVAAHLARGVPLEDLGRPLDRILWLPRPRPVRRSDGTLEAHVLHIDRFGNLITDLEPADLRPLGPRPVFTVGSSQIVGLVRTYAEGQGLVALVGSSGHLEIALPNGSAARQTGLDLGAIIVVAPGGG